VNQVAKPDVVSQSSFAGASGTDLSLFAKFEDGQCSTMGFDWLALEKMILKMKWVDPGVRAKNIKEVTELLKEFGRVGYQVLVRQQPACDLDKAGKIDCKLLYFPVTEHRCQLVRRIEKVYTAIAQNCNNGWIAKFGGYMDSILAGSGKYKGGNPCPEVEYL